MPCNFLRYCSFFDVFPCIFSVRPRCVFLQHRELFHTSITYFPTPSFHIPVTHVRPSCPCHATCLASITLNGSNCLAALATTPESSRVSLLAQCLNCFTYRLATQVSSQPGLPACPHTYSALLCPPVRGQVRQRTGKLNSADDSAILRLGSWKTGAAGV